MVYIPSWDSSTTWYIAIILGFIASLRLWTGWPDGRNLEQKLDPGISSVADSKRPASIAQNYTSSHTQPSRFEAFDYRGRIVGPIGNPGKHLNRAIEFPYKKNPY